MKLVYITNARIPTEKAHGIQIANNCSAFTKNGARVVLVVPNRKNIIKESCFEFHNLEDRFKIVKLPVLDLMNWKILPQRFSFNIVRLYFIFFGVLYVLFFTNRNDIIYTRSKKIILPISLIRKNIYFEANDELLKDNFMSKIIVDRSKGIIVVNNRLKEKYKELFAISDRKILVAPNGVDIKKFNIKISKLEAKNKLNLPQDKKIIGYVGRLETLGQGKGADILIKAFKIIKKEKDDVLLCFVGGPSKRIKEYQDLASEIGLKHKDIVFIKQVEYKLIPKYLKTFDILAMPFPRTEHYAYYMSPLKLFEYMAAKRPIVASDLPSIREILNEKNAVLVEPNSSEALAKGIKKVLEHSDIVEKISNQAFQDVQKHTWQKRAKNILRFSFQNIC